MIERKVRSQSTQKIPSYLPIYNMLYSDIVNGKYENNSVLPSENSLSEKYEVSRHTIRQALTILDQDGLIQKQQGKGSIVTYNGMTRNSDRNHLYNPVLECAKEEIDEINIGYNFAPPTDIAVEKLGINKSEIIMASNNMYFIKNKSVAHGFFQIPVKYIHPLPIDLNREEDVSRLINTGIFEMAYTATVYVRLILAEENITEFLDIEEREPLIYIEEILKNEMDESIARCKYYFIPRYFDINFKIK